MSTQLDYEIIDELQPQDDDIVHLVCCKDSKLRLCGGINPSGECEEFIDNSIHCVSCLHEEEVDSCPKFGGCIDPDFYHERFDN